MKATEFKVGMRVKDNEGYTGVIHRIDDTHNIFVHLDPEEGCDEGGGAVYCCEVNCDEYFPCYPL